MWPGQAQLRMESVVTLEISLCCKTQPSVSRFRGAASLQRGFRIVTVLLLLGYEAVPPFYL